MQDKAHTFILASLYSDFQSVQRVDSTARGVCHVTRKSSCLVHELYVHSPLTCSPGQSACNNICNRLIRICLWRRCAFGLVSCLRWRQNTIRYESDRSRSSYHSTHRNRCHDQLLLPLLLAITTTTCRRLARSVCICIFGSIHKSLIERWMFDRCKSSIWRESWPSLNYVIAHG